MAETRVFLGLTINQFTSHKMIEKTFLTLCFGSALLISGFICVRANKTEYEVKEFLDFEEYDLESTTIADDILYRSDYEALEIDCECGKRNPGLHPKLPKQLNTKYSRGLTLRPKPLIVDGTAVKRSEFPWLAAVTQYIPRKPFWKVVCGANLLNSRYLVTVAHCFGPNRYKDAMEIVLNAVEVNNLRNDTEVVRRKIKRIVKHPLYNPKTNENDIALIELKIPVDLITQKKIIRPVCLPNGQKDFANKIATVAGWGWTSYPKGSNSPNLLKIDLPIWQNSECIKTRINSTGKFTNSMLCAGLPEGGKDSCTNDSGSGLLVPEESNRNVLAGLVSWGVAGCGVENAPGVYTRVGNYLTWLKEEAHQGEWCKK